MSSISISVAAAVTASAASSLLVLSIILVIAIGRSSSRIGSAFAFAPPLRHRHHPRRWHLLQRDEQRHNSSPIIITTTTITTTTTRLSSSSSSLSSSSSSSLSSSPMWDPTSQTYLNGLVPSNHDSSSDINTLLSLNGDGKLKIFGYGSLCWHAGSEGGVLSLANREEEEEMEEEEEEEEEEEHYLHPQQQQHPKIRDECTKTTTTTTTISNNTTTTTTTNTANNITTITNKRKKERGVVTTSPGMAIGYQRCWSQRSADHRGTPQFNGIVCTLLSDDEVDTLHSEEISKQRQQQQKQEQAQQQQPQEQAQPLQPNSSSNNISSSSRRRRRRQKASMTEGLIYTIDADLVHECLAELDFREKGGYARDIIDVVEVVVVESNDRATTNTIATTTTVEKKYTKALLYRGTPDNPAFWKRVMFDLPLAAAIISLAIGPSGPNDAYLHRLHEFLLATTHGQHATLPDGGGEDGVKSGDVRTGTLARMIELLQSEYRPYIMFGAGSNEHNQLLLTPKRGDESDMHFHNDINNSHENDRKDNVNGCDDDDLDIHYSRQEVHELTEMLLVVPRMQNDNSNDENEIGKVETIEIAPSSSSNPVTRKKPADHDPRSLHAGGGHSGLLTCGGDLFLWGWNDAGQLGRPRMTANKNNNKNNKTPFWNLIPPLSNIKVAVVALGHTHTLIVEKGSGYLYGFGEDSRGQVSGRCRARDGKIICQYAPRRIPTGLLQKERFSQVAAGLFHSAAIIKETGELITWGCGRFGQCLRVDETPSPRQDDAEGASTVGRWRPPDGCKLVQVACGRRHTVALDEHGRVWTFGDNKYGQLGRDCGRGMALSTTEPERVDGPLGQVGSGCFAIHSGWSHVLALTLGGTDDSGIGIKLYGWGRNDKGQLGLGRGDQSIHRQTHVIVPQVLVTPSSINAACCGAESSHVIDAFGNLYSTGWNEHGNLATSSLRGDGSDEGDCYVMNWTVATGADLVAPPSPTEVEGGRKMFAAGGAHLIALAV